MALPPNYTLATNIEELFLFNGVPIVSGNVFTYSSLNPTTPKSIYSQDSLAPLPNPTAITNGKLVDESGTSVKPVYKLVDDNGNEELYYVVVRLNDNILNPELGTLVETRNDWPSQTDTSSGSGSATENFITNGQFRWNTTPTQQDEGLTGVITQAVTPVAAGGWEFIRDEGSTATDRVTFQRYASYVSSPSQSPRYAIVVENIAPDVTDTKKDLSYKWNDVNKFSSDTQEYNFSFGANVNAGTTDLELYIIRNFGTGGTVSPPEETLITTFTITNIFTLYNVSFVFGTSDGFTIGTNDDDYISLVLRCPLNNAFTVTATNFSLFKGSSPPSEYPLTTSRDFLVRSSFYDEEPRFNYNLYLKPIRTASGFQFDYSEIGRVEARILNEVPVSQFDADSNLVLCEGQSYAVNSYSPLGVPMERLWERSIFNSDQATNIFGNGSSFVEFGSNLPQLSTTISVSANQIGDTMVQDYVGMPTSFPINTVSTGNSYINLSTGVGTLYADAALSTAPILGIWGDPDFGSLVPINSPSIGTIPGVSLYVRTLQGMPSFFYSFALDVTAAWAGTYIQFYDPTNTQYYIWVRVNGVGVDPSPGGTGFRVDLIDGNPAWLAASLFAQIIRGGSAYTIQFLSGAAVPPGSAWLFSTYGGAGNWYVWYTVDGLGVDPAIALRTGIKVDLLSTDSALTVTSKTLMELNSIYYAVPDYRGMILRGMGDQWGPEDFVMTQSATNVQSIPHIIQWQSFSAHTHDYVQITGYVSNNPSGVGALDITGSSLQPTHYTGGNSTRPTNASVYYYIRY